MAKLSKIYTVDIWTIITSSSTGFSQPRHLPVPEILPFKPLKSPRIHPATIR